MKSFILLALVASSCLAQRAHLVSEYPEFFVGAPLISYNPTLEQKKQAVAIISDKLVRRLKDKNLVRLTALGTIHKMVYYEEQQVAGALYTFAYQVTIQDISTYIAANIWTEEWVPSFEVHTCANANLNAAIQGAKKGGC